MIVRWEVEDGYAGKSRPQYTTIPDGDLEGLNENECDQVIREYVQDDFNSTISWSILGYED